MRPILVSSHRRSGTHFLIDSIRKNIPGTHFPNHAGLPADFNLGSLFAKSDRIFNIFKRHLDSGRSIIIKSHLLPEECDLTNPRDKHEELIRDIYEISTKLYIARDGMDVLYSLYRFLKSERSFSEFIREPNDHIVHEIRNPQIYDENRVAYWSYHQESWMAKDDVLQLSFEALRQDFESTIQKVIEKLGAPIPGKIEVPQIPRSLLLHQMQKILNHFGILPLPESSSVRPNKGSKHAGHRQFNAEDQAFFTANDKSVG